MKLLLHEMIPNETMKLLATALVQFVQTAHENLENTVLKLLKVPWNVTHRY